MTADYLTGISPLDWKAKVISEASSILVDRSGVFCTLDTANVSMNSTFSNLRDLDADLRCEDYCIYRIDSEILGNE